MSELPENWLETELGLLPVTWQPVEAQQFCKKVADGTHDSPKKQESGKLLITSKNIKDSRLDVESAYHISFDDYIEVNRRSKVDQWDVLLSMIGTVGEVCLIDEEPDFAIKNVGLFKCGDEIKGKWLYYFLKSKGGQHYIYSRLSGTTQKYITLGELRKLPIPSPSPPEQKAIAGVLSAFDEKIELLREQNETLETIAQTIFKEWFVNFNYPGATGEMVDSELGEIPKGWRVGTLEDEFDITIGRTPPRKERHWFSKTPTGKKWTSIKDMVKSGVYIYDTSEYITDEGIEKFNIPIIPKNTVILSFKMTVGKLSITTEDMISNEAIAHMKIKNGSEMISEYIYLFLHDLDFNSLGSTSSIVTAINSTMIKQILFLIPDSNMLQNFDKLISPIFKKIKNNTAQIQTLSKTRDTLLPKLMNGEVRTAGFEQ